MIMKEKNIIVNQQPLWFNPIIINNKQNFLGSALRSETFRKFAFHTWMNMNFGKCVCCASVDAQQTHFPQFIRWQSKHHQRQWELCLMR